MEPTGNPPPTSALDPSTSGRLERLLDRLRGALARVGMLFPRHAEIDDIVTRETMRGPPGEVWKRLVFFEEVPHRPGPMLRLVLPAPLRTSRHALGVGATVRCTYSGGKGLLKRITAVDAPSLLRFEVIEQDLGIEPCMTTVEGAYRIRACAGGSEVALTTRYRGYLRPRWLWRVPERIVARAMHRHILRAIGESRSGSA